MHPDPWPEGAEEKPAPPTRKWCRRQARACPRGLDFGVSSFSGVREHQAGRNRGTEAREPGTPGKGGGWTLAAPDPGVSAPECLEIARPQTGRRDPGASQRGGSPSSRPSASCLTPASGLLPGPVHHRRSRRRLSPGPPGRPQHAPGHVTAPLSVPPHVIAPQNGGHALRPAGPSGHVNTPASPAGGARAPIT